MKSGFLSGIIFLVSTFYSCVHNPENKSLDKAKTIIHNCRMVYGSDMIDQERITFKLREYNYVWDYTENGRLQERITTDSLGNIIKDSWLGENFYRIINQDTVPLTEEAIQKYKNSINSVFYFAFLPKSLTDPAVNAILLESVIIKDQPYHKIKVTFTEEGGGEDYEDIFLYWIHQKSHKLDYMAYQYFTEGGGIRFREAVNHHKFDDIILQDYNNYKPTHEVDDFLHIDSLYMNDELTLVSRIDLENLSVN